jgi:hypothetical protein
MLVLMDVDALENSGLCVSSRSTTMFWTRELVVLALGRNATQRASNATFHFEPIV